MPTLGAYDYRHEVVNAFHTESSLSGIFVGLADRDRHRGEITRLQARCHIPLVVALDHEAGTGPASAVGV
jgi:hypothetical protein